MKQQKQQIYNKLKTTRNNKERKIVFKESNYPLLSTHNNKLGVHSAHIYIYIYKILWMFCYSSLIPRSLIVKQRRFYSNPEFCRINVKVPKQYYHVSSRVNSLDINHSIIPDLSAYPPSKIRNFAIIAHIDHGKSESQFPFKGTSFIDQEI